MTKRKYLTRQEIGRMEKEALNGRFAIRDRCMICMCFMHGFRISELCSLRMSDIDLEARTLFVRRLKNRFSTIHPLTREELPLLMAWLLDRESWREADSPYLFLSQKKALYHAALFMNYFVVWEKKPALAWMSTRICYGTRADTHWRTREWIPV